MNGEATALNAEKMIFSLRVEEKETVEVKAVESGEVKTPISDKFEIKNRFARLKKSLRKRAVSIL